MRLVHQNLCPYLRQITKPLEDENAKTFMGKLFLVFIIGKSVILPYLTFETVYISNEIIKNKSLWTH